MKKLQNKKTGEIGYLIVSKGSDYYTVTNDNWENCGEYNSLAELTAEWEDSEEPKEFWFIGEDAYPHSENDTVTQDFVDRLEQIGNYFETEEEAKKAVEKLKAWKRLRDKGFRFEGWGMFRYSCDDYEYSPHIYFTIPELDEDEPYHYPEDVQKDLDLLFGGEEWLT